MNRNDGVVPIRLGRGFTTAFAVASGDSVGLVDAGLPGSCPVIVDALARHGLGEPRWLLATHLHLDHVGGMRAVHESTGAPVMAHSAEAPYIDGRRRPPQYTDRGSGRVLKLAERFLSLEPVPVARELAHGDSLEFPEELVVLHLPGHTAGHVGLWWPERRTLIAGDAVMRFAGKVVLGWPMDTQDPEAARESAALIASYKPEIVHMAHGKALTAEEALGLTEAREGRLRHFVPSLPLPSLSLPSLPWPFKRPG